MNSDEDVGWAMVVGMLHSVLIRKYLANEPNRFLRLGVVVKAE